MNHSSAALKFPNTARSGYIYYDEVIPQFVEFRRDRLRGTI
jgi:hypothetical protein